MRNASAMTSKDAANCCGMSTGHPRARSRVKSAARSGPPTTMHTVLMFWIHCGWTSTEPTNNRTLLTAKSCSPLGAIW